MKTSLCGVGRHWLKQNTAVDPDSLNLDMDPDLAFQVNPDTDPDPGFSWRKTLEKITAENLFIFMGSKIEIDYIQATEEAVSPQKRTSSNS